MLTAKKLPKKYIVRRAVFCIAAAALLIAAFCLIFCKNKQQDVYTFSGLNDEAKQAVRLYTGKNEIDISAYPASLIELLQRNPETVEFVVDYSKEKDKQHTVDLSEYKNCSDVPLFMQWDKRWGYMQYGSDVAGLTGCGPVCLSMVAFYYTKSQKYTPEKMIRYSIDNGYCVAGSGSSWKLISQGARDLGFSVKELPLDKQTLLSSAENYPLICVMGPGAFTTTGHFIVISGVCDGAFKVNDPNSRKNSSKVWTYKELQDQIKNIWQIKM